jgi:hypothetical protein
MHNFLPTMLASVGFALAAPYANAGDVFTLDKRTLETVDSFAVLTDEFFGGKTLALKILYTPKAITPEVKKDLLENGGLALTAASDHVYLVLFLDKQNQVWQANLTVVLPGQTGGYTVASDPEGLKKILAEYAFDGTRLRLKSQGSHRSEDFGEVHTVTWKVASDLPVHKLGAQTAH